MRNMEYFNEHEFQLLEEISGKYFEASDERLELAYKKLKNAYGKVKYWAEEIQRKIFPDGEVKIIQRPTNQANKFDGYLWAKIYPTLQDSKDKWLAITVGLNDSNKYEIKIDTIGLKENSPLRKKYLNFRGDYKSSKIVIIHQKDKFSDWETLIDHSTNEILDLIPSFQEIKALGRETSEFMLLIDSLQEKIAKNQSVLSDFEFKTYTSKSYYVKIGDHEGIIGDRTAHYEIRNLKSGLYVELHFEGSDKSKANFQSIRLPEGLKWFDWGGYNSIQSIGSIDINDKKAVDKIIQKLLDLENGVGYQARNIIKNGNNLEMMNHNQILYGPPGTGKTYKTKELGVQIANPMFSVDDELVEREKRNLVVAEYNRLCKDGQIVFTTFHQSFSYEDFVEGIKPVTNVEGQLSYDVEHGIFKKICKKAEDNYWNSKKGHPSQLSFDKAFDMLIEEWQENKEMKFPLKTEGYDFTILNFSDRSIGFKKASGGTGHTLSISTLREGYYGNREIRKTGVGIYYPGILTKLKSYKSDVNSSEKDLKNYVLIIDEINRGNVSAIFGELITLLEPDKRLGVAEEIAIKLPYSKDESFCVPPNLYIIGTMNTADRSVEALDTALRRRFVFKEVMPDPLLLSEKTFDDFNLEKVLTTINDRVEALLDRDHTIGHSYLIKIKSGDTEALLNVFKNNIIPLLQEYFYNDYEKIALVLGEGFVEEKVSKKVEFAKFKNIEVPETDKIYNLISPIQDIEDAVRQLLGISNE